MPLKVYKTPGQLPSFWNESVIFFANILSLFYGNIEGRDVLIQKVGTLETYGSRLIPILNLLYRGQNNLLILEKPPEGHLNNYFAHDLKLSLPQIKVVHHSLYEALGDPAKQGTLDVQRIHHELERLDQSFLDGYVIDDVIEGISGILNKETITEKNGSQRGNDKRLLHDFLTEAGLPTFDTFIAEDIDHLEAHFQALKKKGYGQAVVKSAIGASGIGLMQVALNESSFSDDMPDYMFYEGPVLVQGWLNEEMDGVTDVSSPSVQIFLKHDRIYLYDVTDQILTKESVHEGNLAPAQFVQDEEIIYDELLQQSETVTRWLYEQGYRGTGSVDFHVCFRHGKLEVRVCEINARVTGATYPAVLARHFTPMDAWMMRNILFKKPVFGKAILEELDKKYLLYRPGNEEGVLPFNFNAVEGGTVQKGQFLFLSKTQDGARKQLEKMCLIDAIQGDFDRD